MVFHNLGTLDVFVAIYDYIGQAVTMPLEIVDENSVRLNPTHPNELRVVVIG